MIFCLDSGNSRLKWGVHDRQRWVAQGALDRAKLDKLSCVIASLTKPERILVANVAGNEVEQQIRQALAPWAILPEFIQSGAQAAGINNFYKNPNQLGVDRWCAMIGARRLNLGPMLVVMAGTATTIDTVDQDGNFQGGLILPGIGLMLRALGSGTAALPYADGEHAAFPRCTDDAIVTGIIEAQAGAIERAFRRLDDSSGICLISGGYADVISRHLAVPQRIAQNLPMEGLVALALEKSKSGT